VPGPFDKLRASLASRFKMDRRASYGPESVPGRASRPSLPKSGCAVLGVCAVLFLFLCGGCVVVDVITVPVDVAVKATGAVVGTAVKATTDVVGAGIHAATTPRAASGQATNSQK